MRDADDNTATAEVEESLGGGDSFEIPVEAAAAIPFSKLDDFFKRGLEVPFLNSRE